MVIIAVLVYVAEKGNLSWWVNVHRNRGKTMPYMYKIKYI